jgi:acetyl esterase/lipase
LVEEQASSPVILYLPTGPVAKDTCVVDDDEIITALSAASNATVVRVNYRLGNGVQYPTPIHDVLAAYDWVKQNLPTDSVSKNRHGRPTKATSRFGVCGQLHGGSLATMLALTESRMGESRIVAAAVNNPIVDWVFPDAEAEAVELENDESGDLIDEFSIKQPSALKTILKGKKKKKTSWELYKDNSIIPVKSLNIARSRLFPKPASYFDPFASPILFFRSPGVDVPLTALEAELSELDVFEKLKNETPTKRRKVHRVFPPTASSLRLPDIRISLGDETALYDQGEELVRLLRRSIIRTNEARASNQLAFDRFEEDDLSDLQKANYALAEAEKRIEFHVPSQVGLWGRLGDASWQSDVLQAGTWFRKVLGQA